MEDSIPEKTPGGDPKQESNPSMHVQSDYCNSISYSGFPKCLSCEEDDPEGCRFVFFRLFSTSRGEGIFEAEGFISLKHAPLFNDTIYQLYLAREGRASPLTANPASLCGNASAGQAMCQVMTIEDAQYISSHIRDPVMKLVAEEQEFIHKHEGSFYHKKPLAPFCQICDVCNAGIFSVYWFCRHCGAELCLRCLRMQHAEGFPAPCGRTREHCTADFLPMTNYLPERISKLLSSVKNFQPSTEVSIEPTESLFTPPDSLPYPYLAPEKFGDETFRYFWKKRQPLVLKAPLSRKATAVTPQYFIERYGDAETDTLKLSGTPLGASDFATFFKDFSNAKLFNSNLKIKDFPQSQRFGDVLPCLYTEFLDQLPVPKYTRCDGSLNLVSRLPARTHIRPDLGPKMYAAYAGKTAARTGTTQLHLDPADAINIMQFTAGPAGEAGALWHVFRHSDVGAIRRFLWANLKKSPLGDPIHDQAFYLTDALLKRLREEEGVVPFLIRQKVGETVLIPAGCPHQVRNLFPCIKIALGFVAPESASICVALAKEFCRLPRGHTRNSDILNMPTLLTQAWGTSMQKLGQSVFDSDDIFSPSEPQKRSNTVPNDLPCIPAKYPKHENERPV